MSFDRGPNEALATITDYLKDNPGTSLVVTWNRSGQWEVEVGGWSWGEFDGGCEVKHPILAEALILLAKKLR